MGEDLDSRLWEHVQLRSCKQGSRKTSAGSAADSRNKHPRRRKYVGTGASGSRIGGYGWFFLPVLLLDTARAAEPRIDVRFTPRAPQQIAAFYEARGAPPSMIDILKRECFITVSVHNTGSQVVWVDLAEWRFSTDAGPVKRPHRNYWLNKWEKLGMPMPIRSTFRWTLLPERLDYQPGEREGGNIILPRVRDPIRLEATFSAGSGPGAERWTEHYRDLRCAVDQ